MSLHMICMLNVRTPQIVPITPASPTHPHPYPPTLAPQPMVPPAPAMSVQAFLKTAH